MRILLVLLLSKNIIVVLPLPWRLTLMSFNTLFLTMAFVAAGLAISTDSDILNIPGRKICIKT